MAADFTGFSVLMTDVKGDEIKINTLSRHYNHHHKQKHPLKSGCLHFNVVKAAVLHALHGVDTQQT